MAKYNVSIPQYYLAGCGVELHETEVQVDPLSKKLISTSVDPPVQMVFQDILNTPRSNATLSQAVSLIFFSLCIHLVSKTIDLPLLLKLGIMLRNMARDIGTVHAGCVNDGGMCPVAPDMGSAYVKF